MRIFTLGKNGIPLFFFALILFSGTYSSYGQTTCPTVDADDSTQYFCDAEEAEISELVVTSGTDVVWYASQTSTTPLAETRFLVDGTTYYAGTQDQSCVGNRAEVTVVIASQPVILGLESSFNPTPATKQSVGGVTVVGLCVADVNNPGATVGDFRTNAADPSLVNWYTTREGGTPLAPDTQLQNNTDYFASLDFPEGNCETNRSRVTVRLFSEEAPEGQAEQFFCTTENPTLSDIVATGDNNYYRTATSQTELSPNTALVDGRTYFVSTVGENCESFDRLEVTVRLQEANAGENVSETVCLAELQERLNSETPREVFLSLLNEGVATTGTFNPGIDQLAAQYNNNPYDTFTTTYTVTNDAGCEDSVELALTVTENAYAGEDTDLVFCQAEVQQLISLAISNPDAAEAMLLDMIGDDVDTNGQFSTDLQQIAFAYAAALQNNALPFTATTTYTVGAGTACEDSAALSITVNEGGENFDDISEILCSEEINNPTVNGIRDYYQNLVFQAGLPATGTFNPSPAEIQSQFQAANGIGTFATDYTVDTDCGTVSINVAVQVIENQVANAGEIADVSFDTTSPVYVLDESVLSADATRGGMFTAAEGVLNEEGNFDPSIGAGEYSITYTVDESIACVQGQDSTTFTVTVTDDTTEEDDIFVQICSDQVNNPTLGGFRDFFQNQIFLNSDLPLDGTFNPSMQELLAQYQNNPIDTFTTSYTVNVDGSDVTIQVSVQVVETQTANAGEIADITVQENAGNFVLDESVLSADATRGGMFTAAEGVLNAEGNFNPSVGPGVYTITYTVDESIACVEGQDSTTFTITVAEDTTEEGDIFVQICSDQVNNPTLGGFRDFFQNQIFLNSDLPLDGTFNPSMQELLAQYQNNPIDTFTTSYTVNVDGSDVTIQVSVQVVETQTANAGEIADITVQENAGNVVLDESVLSADATRGGMFTAAEGVLNAEGNFNPSVGPGVYTITYTVDESIACVEGEDSTTFTITVAEDTTEEDDIFVQICSDQVNNPTLGGFRDFFQNQISLNSDLPLDGTFNPSMQELLAQYQNNPIDTFTTSYTVNVDGDDVTIQVSVQVVETQTANAGEIADMTLACGATEIVVLDESLLSDDATRGGTFTAAEGVLNAEGNFDPSVGPGEYTITYSVDDSVDCVEGQDETTFTITVNAGTGEANDVFVQLCEDEINNPTLNGFRNFFTNLVRSRAGLPTTGTFSPAMQELLDQYQANPIGTFTTNYTVDTACGSVTIEVSAEILENEVANAGEVADITVACDATNVVVLDDTLLSADATRGGDFTAEEGVLNAEGNFDPLVGPGEYVITYTVDESINCVEGEDSTTFTITVNEEGDIEGADILVQLCSTEINNPTVSGFTAYFRNIVRNRTSYPATGTFDPSMADLVAQYEAEPIGTFATNYTVDTACGTVSFEVAVQVNAPENADAGGDVAAEFCVAQDEDIELTSLLPEGAQTTGSFNAPYQDGTFNPSVAGLGEFTITYTVVEGNCVIGEDSATITINVTDTVDAPVADDVTFCVAEGATVADLVATGENIRWYTDAELGAPLGEDDALVEGTYYVTQTTAGGCESEAAEVTVTLTDAAAPTLVEDGNVFCEADRPTIADLSSNIVETGTVTWYDAAIGGEAYSSADLLQDGTTYYASLADATSDCESAQRLAVTVSLDICELLIPEAFSPNGDGINDTFEIRNIGEQYPNYTIEIFNRWGNVVYQGNASTPFWNGESTESRTLGSNVLPVGVYFYILNYNDGQTAPTQGRVYLSR